MTVFGGAAVQHPGSSRAAPCRLFQGRAGWPRPRRCRTVQRVSPLNFQGAQQGTAQSNNGAGGAAAPAHSGAVPRTRQADWRQLQDPAKIGGKSRHTVKVEDYGGALSLDTYMRLPVQAYSQLEPGMITALGGHSFLLKLPRTQIFNVWVAPEVEVNVLQREGPPGKGPRIVLESVACHLPGSPFFASLEGRFALHFRTELSWRPASAPGAGAAAGQAAGNGSSGAAGALQQQQQQQQLAARGPQAGEISGDLAVDVWAECPPPFNLMPRAALEGGCNAVLGALISALLPLFMQRLGEDYERWASDPDYRQNRSHGPAPAAATAHHAPPR